LKIKLLKFKLYENDKLGIQITFAADAAV